MATPWKIGGFTARFSPDLSPRNFGRQKNAGLKTLNLPYGFLRPGWLEPRPKENHRENGGSAAQIFPKALHNKILENGKSPLVFPHGIWGELWGNLGSKPHFAYGFLWLGWFGQNLLGVLLPPRPPKNLATLPLGIFRFLGGPKFPKSIERRRPPNPPRPPKVSIGKLGCFPPIFLRALPNSFIWPGWPGPKIPKIYWEARPKETHRKKGVFSPDCPQKLSTGNFGENGKKKPGVWAKLHPLRV